MRKNKELERWAYSRRTHVALEKRAHLIVWPMALSVPFPTKLPRFFAKAISSVSVFCRPTACCSAPSNPI
jgi:hypothetical protein